MNNYISIKNNPCLSFVQTVAFLNTTELSLGVISKPNALFGDQILGLDFASVKFTVCLSLIVIAESF